jgi:hypothetical protein
LTEEFFLYFSFYIANKVKKRLTTLTTAPPTREGRSDQSPTLGAAGTKDEMPVAGSRDTFGTDQRLTTADHG